MSNQPVSPTPSVPLGNIKPLLDAGMALGTIRHQPGYKPFAIVPDGYKRETLEHEVIPPLPDHIRQAVNLHDAQSFIDYVNKFRDPRTIIFATLPTAGLLDRPKLLAVLDYHSHGAGLQAQMDKLHRADQCAHRAEYTCPLDESWKEWAGIHAQGMKQAELVEFLDENMGDIVSPAAATVMELARNFASHTEVKFASKVSPITGGVSLNYQEDTEAGVDQGKFKVFDRMELSLPVFVGQPASSILARVSWVPRDGKLTIVIKLHRPAEVKRLAFQEMVKSITLKTETETVFGSLGSAV